MFVRLRIRVPRWAPAAACATAALMDYPLAPLAFAQPPEPTGQPETTPSSKAKTLSDYYADLGGDDASERVFAARYLKSELLRHTWTYRHAGPDSIAHLDARSALTELDTRIPQSCESALNFPNTAVLCAEMLAELENSALLPQLKLASERARSKAEATRFARAVSAIEAAAAAP